MPGRHKPALVATVLAAAFAGSTLSPAKATLITIGVSTSASGPVTQLGTDGGTGTVLASGNIGNFDVASVSAAGAPILPQPELDTSTLDVSTSGGGTLYMFITEQGLTSPTGINSFLSSFTFNQISGGIASVTEETFISAGNLLYRGTALSSYTATGVYSTLETAASPLISGPYSETIEYIINATGIGSTNDTVDLGLVPEPATYAVFGVGLAAMALLTRRRQLL